MNSITKAIVAPFVALKALTTRSMVHPNGAPWWSWWFRAPRFDYEGSVGDAAESSAVQATVWWAMRVFSQLPVQLETRAEGDKWEVSEDHPMTLRIESPNPFYDGDLLMSATVGDLMLTGNAYWAKVPARGGGVAELWWIPSSMIEPKWPQENSNIFISHYEYTVAGKIVRLNPSEVVHFRDGMDPHNTRKGLSPIKSIMKEIYTDEEAANYTATLLRNGAVPGVMVAPKDSAAMPSAEDVEATKNYFDDQFTGNNRGKTLAMSAPTEVTQFGFNPQQMNLRDLRIISEERITARLGIPAMVVGLGAGLDRSTFSNSEEADRKAYANFVFPMERRIASAIRRQLLPDYTGLDTRAYWVSFDHTEVPALQEDVNERAQRMALLAEKGLITVAEVQRQMDLPVDEAQNVYLRPSGVIEVREGENGNTLEHQDQVRQEQTEAAARMAESRANALGNGQPNGNRNEPPQRRALPDFEQKDIIGDSLLLRFKRDAEQLEAAFVPSVEAVFQALGDKVATAFRQAALRDPLFGKEFAGFRYSTGPFVLDGNPEPRLMNKEPIYVPNTRLYRNPDGSYGGENSKAINPSEIKDDPTLTRSDALVVQAVIDAIDPRSFKVRRLEPIFAAHYLLVAEKTFETVGNTLGVSMTLDNPNSQRALLEGGRRAGLMDLEADVKDALFKTLADGRAAGEGIDDLADRVRRIVPAGRFKDARTRAELIARTETKYAQNVSALQSYRASSVVPTVQAADDLIGHGDGECSARNGQYFTVEEAGNIADHPNGTLTWVPVVEEA